MLPALPEAWWTWPPRPIRPPARRRFACPARVSIFTSQMNERKDPYFHRKVGLFLTFWWQIKNFKKSKNNACIFESYVVLYRSRRESGKQNIRVWRSLLSRLNGVQEASSSNLDTRTIKTERANALSVLIFLFERFEQSNATVRGHRWSKKAHFLFTIVTWRGSPWSSRTHSPGGSHGKRNSTRWPFNVQADEFVAPTWAWKRYEGLANMEA